MVGGGRAGGDCKGQGQDGEGGDDASHVGLLVQKPTRKEVALDHQQGHALFSERVFNMPCLLGLIDAVAPQPVGFA